MGFRFAFLGLHRSATAGIGFVLRFWVVGMVAAGEIGFVLRNWGSPRDEIGFVSHFFAVGVVDWVRFAFFGCWGECPPLPWGLNIGAARLHRALSLLGSFCIIRPDRFPARRDKLW